MGNFSRDTFDKLKHYVGVRLQQGVPIVDADWNELEDIRKYELQAFLKWFVGNGVPHGNDGFRILPAGSNSDFVIKGGDGTPEGAGRCIVDGWDVINENNLNYTAQPLYNNADLSDKWGVRRLDPLTPFDDDRTDTVYLDVWEREVNAKEDTKLINPAIGIETCVRRKREWVVRVANGVWVPPPPPPGHIFYVLAILEQYGGQTEITAGQIIDQRRQTGLLSIASLTAEIVDARGTKDSLGRRLDESLEKNGQLKPQIVGMESLKENVKSKLLDLDKTLGHLISPRPGISLLDAVNAAMWGTLPATLEQTVYIKEFMQEKNVQIAPCPDDPLSKIMLVWTENAKITTTWVSLDGVKAPQRLTGDDAASERASEGKSAVLRDGKTIWVFWKSDRNGLGGNKWNIYSRRYISNQGWGLIEEHGDAAPPSSSDDNRVELSAFQDSQGQIWLLWVDKDRRIQIKRYSGINWSQQTERASSNTYNRQLYGENAPVAIEAKAGVVMLFWEERTETPYSNNIWYRKYVLSVNKLWKSNDPMRLTTNDSTQDIMQPFRKCDGTVWLFWGQSVSSASPTGGGDVVYNTYYSEFSPEGDPHTNRVLLFESKYTTMSSDISISGHDKPFLLPALFNEQAQYLSVFYISSDGRLAYKNYINDKWSDGISLFSLGHSRLWGYADGVGGVWLVSDNSNSLVVRKVYGRL